MGFQSNCSCRVFYGRVLIWRFGVSAARRHRIIEWGGGRGWGVKSELGGLQFFKHVRASRVFCSITAVVFLISFWKPMIKFETGFKGMFLSI